MKKISQIIKENKIEEILKQAGYKPPFTFKKIAMNPPVNFGEISDRSPEFMVNRIDRSFVDVNGEWILTGGYVAVQEAEEDFFLQGNENIKKDVYILKRVEDLYGEKVDNGTEYFVDEEVLQTALQNGIIMILDEAE